MQTSTYLSVVWFVIAAFSEEKQWCGVQFGMSDYNPEIMYYTAWGPCYPPDGGLELSSDGWPGPLEGTAFVSTGTPWEGNWLPMYWFYAYAYGYSGPGVVQLVPDPSVMVPFAGFGNCEIPAGVWDAALGGMGVNHPGTWICWSPDDYVCCVGEDCVIVHSEDECTALGGEFHPEWSSCGPPNPCLPSPVRITSWGAIKTLYR
jgi:hypothetical protein